MKRTIIALLVGGLVFGTVLAVAASLTVNGGTIQAGSDTDLQCDEGAVRVDGWMLETDTGMVIGVRIHDIDEACSSNDLFVNITNNGNKISEGVKKGWVSGDPPGVHIPNDADADDNDTDANEVGVKVYLNPPVQAVDITDIEVFIEGPNG